MRFLMLLWVTTVLLPPQASADDSVRVRGPRLTTDLMVVGGVTAFYTVAHPSVRQGFWVEGSFEQVAANFKSPIRRLIEGGREDQDPFGTNFVAHPMTWGLLGLYLKERGYSNVSALVFTQAHSIIWEYVIEGTYQKPSSKDAVTNLAGASVAIFAFHALAERAAQREDKRLIDRFALLLNPLRPFRTIFAGDHAVSVSAMPDVPGGGVGITVTVAW